LVATNQSGISRGYYSSQDVKKLHSFINSELNKNDTNIDEFYYSPYHPEYHSKFPELSNLRKPNTGMLEMAHDQWNFDKTKSLLIGDSESDMLCAKKFGIKGYLFNEDNLLSFVKKNNL
jgi:histidinol-phosphate phosphatase family protein